MNAEDQAKWHWAEGMKYALKGMELLFILNGAASVSILTFIGNKGGGSALLVGAMVSFALGAIMTVFLMFMAYFTQLLYGNESLGQYRETPGRPAAMAHNAAYVFIAVCTLFSLLGVGLGACGLMHFHPQIDTPPSPSVDHGQNSQIDILKRQKDDTLYEIQIRQTELDSLMAAARVGTGVGPEWIARKAELTEKIVQLQVRGHDLDLQINAYDSQNIRAPKGLTLIH